MANQRWSWGGVDESKKRVFLRAWQDETQLLADGNRAVRLSYSQLYDGESKNAGFNERTRHLSLLGDGYKGFVVFCKAVDTSAYPRMIESFNDQSVITLGDLHDIDGDIWATLKERINIRDLN